MRIVRADSPDCGCNTDSDNAVSFRAVSKHCRRLVRSKKLNDEHHVARRAYVGSNAKRRPMESLSPWRVLKHASLEFEKCGSGFRKVTHTVARLILTKPELQRNLRCSVALNTVRQCAQPRSPMFNPDSDGSRAREPVPLPECPRTAQRGCFLVEHQEKPCEVKHSFTGRVPELKESRDEARRAFKCS